MQVYKQDADGWSTCECKGKTGLVPNDYLSPTRSEQTLGLGSAVFDYSALQAGELTFASGDKITILLHQDDGWSMGEMKNGKRGFYPTQYVE